MLDIIYQKNSNNMMSPYRRRTYGPAQWAGALYQGYRGGQALARDMKTAKTYVKSATQAYNAAPAQPLQGKKAYKKKRRVPRGKSARKLDHCARAIKDLRQSEKASLGTLKYRSFVCQNRLLSAESSMNSMNINQIGTANLEAVMTKLKFFNPAIPGTLTEASGVAGTYQRNIYVKNIASEVLLRNNYQTDAKVTVYLCTVRDDTSQTPTLAWDKGIEDGTNLTLRTELNQYPTDYNLFNDLWHTRILSKQTLSPGQSIECKYQTKGFEYDPATVDTHTLTFQSEYRGSCVLVVLEGTLAHDSVADQQGLAPAGVDISYKNTYTVSYNAGINISYTFVDNAVSTMTTLPVQGHQPISDNQSYSVS